MLLKANKQTVALILVLFCVIKCEFAECYKSEVVITPAPTEGEESTTKKSDGFFGGIKSFFRGSSSSTTTTPSPLVDTSASQNAPKYQQQQPAAHTSAPQGGAAQKPPPLVISHAPLMPLGPRPDTPSTSPLAGNQHQPPLWPQSQAQPVASTTTSTTTKRPQLVPQFPQQAQTTSTGSFGSGLNGQQPNFLPGFAPYRPPKAQPSGLDLSYGGAAGRPQAEGGTRPGFGLAPLTSSTTTTTTTTTTSTPKPAPPPPPPPPPHLLPQSITTTTTTKRPQQAHEDFPALPPPRRPSVGAKEDYPVMPTPKSPMPTPVSPLRPSSPSAWNTPLSTPAPPSSPGPHPAAPISPVRPVSPPSGADAAGGNRVSFVPHVPSASTTTVRPGVQSTGNSLATDAEIYALTETLYTKETNSQLSSITVNLQGRTRSIDSTDEAPQPLLTIDEKVLDTSTISKMRLLFNNYEVDTLVNEHVTANERKEENDFLDAVMATNVMRQAMLFLQSKGIVSPDPKTHRDLVKELWFTQYSRGSGKIGSSGFEHVFVNEVKNGTIIGFHNWVYIYDEEKAGRFDYKGYLHSLDLGTKGKVLKIRFTHNGLSKPVNSMFVGTSPELELALYTLCFQLRPDRTCPVSLGNNKFGIVTYSWRYRGKNLIGSAYPEI